MKFSLFILSFGALMHISCFSTHKNKPILIRMPNERTLRAKLESERPRLGHLEHVEILTRYQKERVNPGLIVDLVIYYLDEQMKTNEDGSEVLPGIMNYRMLILLRALLGHSKRFNTELNRFWAYQASPRNRLSIFEEICIANQ